MKTQLNNLLTEIALAEGYSLAAMQAGELAYLRRCRKARPEGIFDKAKRFKLTERCACCEGIRGPSRAYPNTELDHGRTDKHIATRFNVPVTVVRKMREAFALLASVDGMELSEHMILRSVSQIRQILTPKAR